jgi:hypothetical protein
MRANAALRNFVVAIALMIMQACNLTQTSNTIARVEINANAHDFDLLFNARKGTAYEFHITGDVPVPIAAYDAPQIRATVEVAHNGQLILRQQNVELGAFWAGERSGFRFSNFRLPGLPIRYARCTAHVHLDGDIESFSAKWRPRMLEISQYVGK